MSKLVSDQLNSLRHKFRQFEHGGHCFGSEEITGLVEQLRLIAADAAALEDRVAGARRQRGQIPAFPPPPPRPPMPPRPQPGAMAIGTFYFVPAGEPRPGRGA